MSKIGIGSIEVILLFQRAPQRIVSIVDFSHIVGAPGTLVGYFSQQVTFFLPGIPSFEGVGVGERFQKSMNCMIAVSKPFACMPERNGAKAFIHIIIPNGLKNDIVFVLQTIARKPSQTVNLVVKPAGHQTCRIFLYRFIILVIGKRTRTGIIRYLR